jgi:putative ABC transport system permease protein
MTLDLGELRITLRSLARARLFSLSVVAVLACGSALAAVVASVVDAVLVRPLPFAQADRLVALWSSSPARGLDKTRVSGPEYESWRQAATAFDRMALFGSASYSLVGRSEAAQVAGARVSAAYFPLLGVQPSRGRFLGADDYRGGSAPAVVINEALRRRRFPPLADPVGQVLKLDDTSYTIVGVAPPQVFPTRAAPAGKLELGRNEEFVWVPLPATPTHNGHTFGVLARLAPGVTLAQATSQLQTIAARRAAEAHLPARESEVRVVSLRQEAVGDIERPLVLVAVAIGLVLLAATANVAGLMLVRVAARRRELAVRRALGASPGRLFARFLIEAALLSAAGALAGLAVANGLLRYLPTLLPREVPRMAEASLDPAVFAVVAVAALLSALCVAGVPLLAARAGASLEETLRESGRGITSRGASRAAPLLIALEMALAVVLVVGSALLFTSLGRLRAVDPGFSGGNLLVVDLVHQQFRYPERRDLDRFYAELFTEVRRLPGVRGVAASYDRPLASSWYQSFDLEGAPADRGLDQGAVFRTVTPEYFATLGIALLAGRELQATDDASHPGAAVVNAAFARRFLAGRALGRHMSLTTTQWLWGDQIPRRFEIVGVVEDERFAGLDAAAEPAFYLPYRQTPHHMMSLLVRTSGDPQRVLPGVRSVLRRIDPDLPIAGTTTLQEILDRAVAKPRFDAVTLGVFSGVALLLALAGLSAFLANVMRQRRRDVAVRMALGATGARVAAGFVAYALRPALLGVLLGLGGAVALGRLLRGLLFGVSPLDVPTYAGSAVGLLLVATLAASVPALRAARTRPATVLHEE